MTLSKIKIDFNDYISVILLLNLTNNRTTMANILRFWGQIQKIQNLRLTLLFIEIVLLWDRPTTVGFILKQSISKSTGKVFSTFLSSFVKALFRYSCQKSSCEIYDGQPPTYKTFRIWPDLLFACLPIADLHSSCDLMRETKSKVLKKNSEYFAKMSVFLYFILHSG